MVDEETGSSLSANLHRKVTLIVVEFADLLPKQIGNVPGDERACSVLTAVHKHSFLL